MADQILSAAVRNGLAVGDDARAGVAIFGFGEIFLGIGVTRLRRLRAPASAASRLDALSAGSEAASFIDRDSGLRRDAINATATWRAASEQTMTARISHLNDHSCPRFLSKALIFQTR
jgi:hypothetical protein